MPPDASATREKLLDAAARAFAEHGVLHASLLDITRQAGQRNRSAQLLAAAMPYFVPSVGLEGRGMR